MVVDGVTPHGETKMQLTPGGNSEILMSKSGPGSVPRRITVSNTSNPSKRSNHDLEDLPFILCTFF